MPITMVQRSRGMPAAGYDEIMSNVREYLRQSPGFISHTAQVTDDGVMVTEVWETREQWEQWYDNSVKPHLPEGAPDPTVTELHNAVGR